MNATVQETDDVIIIGSGLGGLLCGAILSKEGMKVRVLEKNSEPGGCLQSFRFHGTLFDTGLHYIGSFLPDQPLYRYWNYPGLSGNLRTERMNGDGFDRICLGDREYSLAQGMDNFRDQLLASFPGEPEALNRYIRTLTEAVKAFPMYNLELPDGHPEEAYRSMGALDFFRSLGTQDLLREVLSGNQFLYGGLTDTTPFHIPALINHSFISSAFRLSGGSRQIIELLSDKISSAGGSVGVGQEVVQVNREKNGFSCTTANHNKFISEILIADIHPVNLINITDPSLFTPAFRHRVSGLKNTVSSFTLYLSLKENSFPYLDYNVHYYSGKGTAGASVAEGRGWPAHFMLYTPAPRTEAGFAGSLVVMTWMKEEETAAWKDTRTGDRGDSYSRFKQERSEKLLDLVARKFPRIRESIACMTAATPLTWRDYTGTPGGSLYGLEKDWHDPTRSLILPRTRVPGLYFTGQNTNLHGALGVTLGAYLTCGEILGLEYLIKKVRDAD